MNTDHPTQPPSITDPEAWRQVLSDYELNPSADYYLCNNSDLFHTWWNDLKIRAEIRALTQEFAPDYAMPNDFGGSVLFKPHTLVGNNDRYQLRLDFLNWVINRLTSNAPSASTAKED